MKKFEYIRIEIDWNDLDQLNQLGSIGFEVVTSSQKEEGAWLLLCRDITNLKEE
jgi:hypothetical protein